MGMLTDFILAEPSDATAICRSWPQRDKWPCLRMTWLDNSMLAALALAWNDESLAEKLESGAPVAAKTTNEGPWVFCLPDDFRDRLAALTPEQAPAVAQAWAQQEAPQSGGWAADNLEPILDNLREFAQRAVREGKSILLWVCL